MTRRTHTVRTTRRPDLVIEVDDATLLDLTRSGQLLPLEPEQAAEKTDEAVTPPDDAAASPAKRLAPRERRTTDQQ